MAELLRIFVSATADLDAERAIIGRIVAGLPVQIGTEIRRTPTRGASYDDIYELIANCDRVYFLLGQDISAPSGAEWDLAWQLERSVLPLRLPSRPTPAAREFLGSNPFIDWVDFTNATMLNRIVTLDLLSILNHPTNRYGLSVSEFELLALHREKLKRTVTELPDDPGGAEGGGVILDHGRRDPIDGVLLGETY